MMGTSPRDDDEAVDILIVDDNPDAAELTIRALRRHGLAEHLHHVEDGAQALDFLYARGAYHERDPAVEPKLVLLDLSLPNINGFEVLRHRLSDSRLRTIPTVVMSTSQNPHDVDEAERLGADGYIVKGSDSETFNQVVGNLSWYYLHKAAGSKKD